MNFGDYMKKDEFISRLDEALVKLEEADRKKVLRKYKSAFTRKLNQGQNEDDIIGGFGNFNELVKNILVEHGVDTPAQESAGTIASFFKEFLDVAEDIVQKIKNSNTKDKLIFILQIVLVILCISLLKFPVLFLRDLLGGLLNYFFTPLSLILNFIWRFICELSYIIIAITLFVKVFNTILHPRRRRK